MTAAVATPASDNPAAYFKRTKLHWMIAIGTGLAFYTWAVISPETFPYAYLGPFGTFTTYMLKNHNVIFKIGCYGSWLIHVAEAFISFEIFRKKGITDPTAKLKWFVQTVCFGFGSFGLLLAYDPKKSS